MTKMLGVVFGCVAAVMALGWIFQGNDWFMYRFFAPRYEQVRRQTYEQTKSYRQGSVQRLNTLCTQASEADEDHRGMVNDVIAQEFAEWDSADVPAYLRQCLSSARGR